MGVVFLNATDVSVDLDELTLYALCLDDLEQVLAIEEDVYAHPWSRGNFLDSFAQNYPAFGFRRKDGRGPGELLGYFFVMPVVDELHLLTIAVAREFQGQGYAFQLLSAMRLFAENTGFESIMLEVRVSNLRAIRIYERFGFLEIGRRRAYYPAEHGAREDAIVMRLSFNGRAHA